jgi:hypothetical protein
MVESVVIFKSDQFDADASSASLGLDCAEYILAKLLNRDDVSLSQPPSHGDAHWTMGIKLRSHQFGLHILWAPVGKPQAYEDYWVVQLNESTGLKLPGRSSISMTLLKTILDDLLKQDPGITDVRWLNDEEFRKLY